MSPAPFDYDSQLKKDQQDSSFVTATGGKPKRHRSLVILLTILTCFIVLGAALVIGVDLYARPHIETTSGLQASSSVQMDSAAAKTAAAIVLAEYSKYPFLSLLPSGRVLTTSSFPEYQTFTYEGVSLSLPWNTAARIQSAAGVGTQIRFVNGKFVMLVNPYPDPLHRQEFLFGLKNDKTYLFDLNSLATNSAFFNLVLHSSPQTLSSATSSAKDLLAASLLLPLKLQMFYDSSTAAIYEFAMPHFKVFEFTSLPLVKQSYIYYYDEQDQGHILTTSADQDEIDFILSSLRETGT